VPILFIAAIISAGILGWIVSILYAEPMNRFLRRRTATDNAALGAALPEAN
jgi:hypothetical protein